MVTFMSIIADSIQRTSVTPVCLHYLIATQELVSYATLFFTKAPAKVLFHILQANTP